MPITHLSGLYLKRAVISGAQRVIQMQEQLNNINVFPVADSDTGTNMALTMRSVAEGALSCKEGSVQSISQAVADSALMAARGNSGAILAQFFQGLAEGLRGRVRATLEDFAHAVQRASRCAEEAIADPKEGTILTVIRDWAHSIQTKWRKAADFRTLIADSLHVATQSLQETPRKLKVLAKAGVVDAGAQGFVHLLEGVLHFIQSGKIDRVAHAALTFGNAKAKVEEAPEEITFQYCTEALIIGENINRSALKERLRPMGDSMIVAGSDERVRLHIHTNEPEQVFAIARNYGQVVHTKKEDMRQQHTKAHHDPEADTIALITDSSCDLPPDEFISRGIRVVPVVVIFGNQSYIDKVTMTDRDFYDMLVTSPHHPKTSQPAPGDFQEVFLQAAANHKRALAIILSGAVSGTLQAAQHAAQTVRDRIDVQVIDSKNVCIGLGLILREAADAIESGANLEELKQRINWAIQNVRFFVSLATTEYLVRSGRVSKVRGTLARLLNLKPILQVTPAGKVEVVTKTFGGKYAQRKLLELVKREARGKRKLRFLVAHANAPEAASYYAEQIRRYFEVPEVSIVSASPALGAHAGPGAVGIAFLGE
ncbi:MAG: DegV family EDD domain-containing protein [candidate division KSB1 bacterium]|nr:DegV family EDD domain-containing protein [candidate division KSB1 bacterium]MDZ7305128.1 DegV family EDD domain-containing protein [candidate division KSB1 bacterium]MDZ7314352.1 DegV family EDD domain-containing protein [candidate division KSB1 bacterium]